MYCADRKKNHSPALRKGVAGALAALLLIVADQLTKRLAVSRLKDGSPFVLWDGVFELRYLENRGMAFGIFQNQRWIFVAMTVVVLAAVLLLYFRKIPPERRYFMLNLIAVLFFAGAVGNLIDRVRCGYVVDFFYFRLIDFPIFNMADIYVTVGAFLLILLSIFYYKEEDFDRILG